MFGSHRPGWKAAGWLAQCLFLIQVSVMLVDVFGDIKAAGQPTKLNLASVGGPQKPRIHALPQEVPSKSASLPASSSSASPIVSPSLPPRARPAPSTRTRTPLGPPSSPNPQPKSSFPTPSTGLPRSTTAASASTASPSSSPDDSPLSLGWPTRELSSVRPANSDDSPTATAGEFTSRSMSSTELHRASPPPPPPLQATGAIEPLRPASRSNRPLPGSAARRRPSHSGPRRPQPQPPRLPDPAASRVEDDKSPFWEPPRPTESRSAFTGRAMVSPSLEPPQPDDPTALLSELAQELPIFATNDGGNEPRLRLASVVPVPGTGTVVIYGARASRSLALTSAKPFALIWLPLPTADRISNSSLPPPGSPSVGGGTLDAQLSAVAAFIDGLRGRFGKYREPSAKSSECFCPANETSMASVADTSSSAGASGIAGTPEPAGVSEPAGAPGPVSAPGHAGASGSAGAPGPVGASGSAGAPGPAGTLGPAGAPGSAGAYEPAGALAPSSTPATAGDSSTAGAFPSASTAAPVGGASTVDSVVDAAGSQQPPLVDSSVMVTPPNRQSPPYQQHIVHYERPAAGHPAKASVTPTPSGALSSAGADHVRPSATPSSNRQATLDGVTSAGVSSSLSPAGKLPHQPATTPARTTSAPPAATSYAPPLPAQSGGTRVGMDNNNRVDHQSPYPPHGSRFPGSIVTTWSTRNSTSEEHSSFKTSSHSTSIRTQSGGTDQSTSSQTHKGPALQQLQPPPGSVSPGPHAHASNTPMSQVPVQEPSLGERRDTAWQQAGGMALGVTDQPSAVINVPSAIGDSQSAKGDQLSPKLSEKPFKTGGMSPEVPTGALSSHSSAARQETSVTDERGLSFTDVNSASSGSSQSPQTQRPSPVINVNVASKIEHEITSASTSHSSSSSTSSNFSETWSNVPQKPDEVYEEIPLTVNPPNTGREVQTFHEVSSPLAVSTTEASAGHVTRAGAATKLPNWNSSGSFVSATNATDLANSFTDSADAATDSKGMLPNANKVEAPRIEPDNHQTRLPQPYQVTGSDRPYSQHGSPQLVRKAGTANVMRPASRISKEPSLVTYGGNSQSKVAQEAASNVVNQNPSQAAKGFGDALAVDNSLASENLMGGSQRHHGVHQYTPDAVVDGHNRNPLGKLAHGSDDTKRFGQTASQAINEVPVGSRHNEATGVSLTPIQQLPTGPGQLGDSYTTARPAGTGVAGSRSQPPLLSAIDPLPGAPGSSSSATAAPPAGRFELREIHDPAGGPTRWTLVNASLDDIRRLCESLEETLMRRSRGLPLLGEHRDGRLPGRHFRVIRPASSEPTS